VNAREEILKAADELFGKVGFDAATTREIAELSGVNKALIHYHFESKEALFVSVLDSYYERLSATVAGVLEGEGSMRERIVRLIDAYVDFLSRNINFSRIMQRESSGGKHMDRIRDHLAPMFRVGLESVRKAYPSTRSGDMAAQHLLVSFYGMIVTYFTYSDILKHLLDVDPLSEREIEKRKRHLHKMLELVEKMIGEEEKKAGP